MNMPLRVLIVEDSEFDTLLLVDALHRSGYEPDFARVETREAMASALASKTWDVVVSDHNLPRFSMFEALQLLEQSGHDLPFIIVSGGIGEDTAVAAMKAGAHDYLMKGDLSRLAPAVARELRQAAVRAARRQAETALRESELRYRLLWEASTDAVIFVDAGGQIHFANPAVETVFGYPPGEVIGQSVTLLQPQGPVGEALPTNWELPPDGVSSRRAAREARGRHKDGHIFPVDIAWSLIDWQGVKWRVAFIRDLTELKKTAQALRENEEQFRVAREIQERLFPKAAPQWPGIDLAGASFPAKATGGDYFDYLSVADGGWGIVVGDVSGHGVGPAMLMAETRAYLRILAQNRGDLGEILARANRALVEDVSDGRFVTLMLAKFESAGRALVYANAGHPPAFVLDASGQVKSRLTRTGIPLGLRADTQYATSAPIGLAPGDVILLLTDGIEEALSPAEEFYGVERVLEVVRANQPRSAQEIVAAIFQALRAFTRNSPQLDDLTVVVAKVVPLAA